MGALEQRIGDELIRAGSVDLRVASEAGGGEKLQGFFTELGAPGTGVRGEKPGGLFTSDPDAKSAEDLAPAVKRGGRPTVFTPELRERLEMLLSVGMSRRQASAYVGIDHTTVTKAVARDKDLALDLKIAEERASVNPLLTIISESRKNWRAAAWLLKYRGELPVDRVEKTEEEKELEHQRKIAEDEREAERDSRRMAMMRDAVQGISPKALRGGRTASVKNVG
jgi:hypothetical protein